MNREELRKVYVAQGVKAYRKSDDERWHFALFASRIVGKYDRGATIGFAADANVSEDKVEADAHAYTMFEELCNHDNGTFRLFVFGARRAPYIYISHFRALYKARIDYKLSVADILSLLADIVQAEGDISSRAVDVAARVKYGDTRDWKYYAKQAMKGLNELKKQPDLPSPVRAIVDKLFSLIGDQT